MRINKNKREWSHYLLIKIAKEKMLWFFMILSDCLNNCIYFIRHLSLIKFLGLESRRFFEAGRLLNFHYYSFKILPRFCLAKHTRIIHHNRLLMTKFGRILWFINQWRQKCSFLADLCTVNRDDVGTTLSCFGCENKNGGHLTRFKKGDICYLENICGAEQP